jgi:riboflavin synthase
MFTGIITSIGLVSHAQAYDGGLKLAIDSDFTFSAKDIGCSIALNGACMTVISYNGGRFYVDVSNESLDKTTLASWQVGERINMERALKVGDELGGHIVLGHIDTVAKVDKVEVLHDNRRLWFFIEDEKYERFIVQKGSVCLNGVSLTVNEVDGKRFSVNLVPHTLKTTNLSLLKASDSVNFELDSLARYAAKLMN